MNSELVSVERAGELIRSAKRLLIAGDEGLLRKLPRGEWIGGTTPYFMAPEGGVATQERVMVTTLPDEVLSTRIVAYAPQQLALIPNDYPANGVSFIILPAGSTAHQSFGHDVSNWSDVFQRPLVGWIAGYNLATQSRAFVVDGRTGSVLEDAGLVMHCELRRDVVAQVAILNLFRPGDGDRLTFTEEGFNPKSVLVNGNRRSFAEYLVEVKADVRVPLVADFAGAMVNVSIQAIDAARGTVALYAPVIEGVEYHLAAPLIDYEGQFRAEMARRSGTSIFACNCVLNFLYAHLEGLSLPGSSGPITFGEVAWMLLNQTMVSVTLRPSGVEP